MGRAALMMPEIVPSMKSPLSFQQDGSRLQLLTEKAEPNLAMRRKKAILPFDKFLVEYLQRLSHLVRRGAKIVIFESHFQSESRRFIAANPDSTISQLRQRYLDLCDAYRLICYTPAQLPLPLTREPWQDCCHAPSKAMGTLISNLVRTHAAK